MTQILLVLASSKVSWKTFHLVGYSLGGGLCVAFTRYFPHLIDSLTLIGGCGLIRRHHVGWTSWLLYRSGLLPDLLVQRLVRRRIRPKDNKEKKPPRSVGAADIESVETKRCLPHGNSDANGGDGFDSAHISKFRPGVTVSSVVQWQVDHHEGFVTAFISTMRHSPIYAPQEDWKALAAILDTRRRDALNKEAGLGSGKIHIVLGEDDPVIVKDETMEDAVQALGLHGTEFTVFPGGHEMPFTTGSGVATAMVQFWSQY